MVRINPNGDAVIAGRAAPGAEVTVMEGDTVIGQVQADQRGEWVLVPDKPLPPGTRVFSLESKLPEQDPIKSESEVVLVVPEGDGTGALACGCRAHRAAADPRQHRSAIALRRRRASSGGVAIGIIDYDENGKLRPVGGKPSARLNVYLDDKIAGSVQADERGEWRLA